jgi:hypothetical protein
LINGRIELVHRFGELLEELVKLKAILVVSIQLDAFPNVGQGIVAFSDLDRRVGGYKHPTTSGQTHTL